MIFGFNSDVRQNDNGAVFHVQSEVRRAEALLETLVFTGGRCLCKQTMPIRDSATLSEADIQEMLKAQHRRVLTVLRERGIEGLSETSRSEDVPSGQASSDEGPLPRFENYRYNGTRSGS